MVGFAAAVFQPERLRRIEPIVILLRRFRAGEYDILLGTQMVAKGHDIPGVTAVGIISALLEGKTLPAAILRGNKIGSLAIQAIGDSEGLPTRAALGDF